ncbi:sporulation protein YjcZ [Paenibacillus alginolyticus]|uniref:sporulation protein YjcZ n=1 Tax=Paenibacillus alginolyticus TaxID=59839 RepID=UPI0003FB4880|nr:MULTISPECIES: sporulation protein YjcZ [Paenibacillus]MCY9665539.1 sporulation protein YjcZ [Paenibacillus alginolyticus]NRF95528.1 sporulation protein YjcZ [Paenibacillus frigoriresistens]
MGELGYGGVGYHHHHVGYGGLGHHHHHGHHHHVGYGMGNNVAFILVLFILLVIITSTFAW